MQGLQKKSFDHVLSKVRRRSKAVLWELERTEKAFTNGGEDAIYDAAFCLAAETEKLAQLTRDLPAHTGNIKAAFDLNDLMIDSSGVEVGYTPEGWFSVQMPALLPRKERGSADYIRTMLYPPVQQFFRAHAPLYFERCVIAFRHVYHQDRPEREYRDHDNIELNMVVDIIALFTMKDDAALRCRHYYCSAPGDTDRTEVYVLPVDDFPRWLQFEKEQGLQAVRLMENPWEKGKNHG